MTFLLMLFLTLAVSFLLASCLRRISAWFLIWCGMIVLNGEIAGLFSLFNEKLILGISLIEFGIVLGWYILKRKKIYFPNIKEELKKVLNAFLLDKSLIIVGLLFVFMMICFLIMAFNSPMLEPDSRMYHFNRVIQYVKQGSFFHFVTNEIRNIVMPVNSEIIYSYFYLFKKNDVGFGFLSYFSFLSSIFSIYLILKELKICIRKRIFAIFATFSTGAILVQIPSLQTDLVIGSLILLSIYFLIKKEETKERKNTPEEFKKERTKNLFLSSLAYSLALGVKTTAIMIFPSFLIILFYLIKRKKEVVLFFGFLILNFIVFSSLNYVLNFVEFKDFIAPLSLKAEHSIQYGIREIFFNLAFNFKSFLGFKSGFFYEIIEKICNPIPVFFNLSNLNNTLDYEGYDERIVGFTYIGIVFIIVNTICIFNLFKKQNKTFKIISLFSLMFLINYIVLSCSMVYFPYSARFFTSFILISGFCFVYAYKIKILKYIILFYSFLNLILYPLLTTRCPFYYLFKADFLNRQNFKETLLYKVQNNPEVKVQYEIYKFIEQNFKKTDKIAIVNDRYFYEVKQLANLGWNISLINLEDLEKESLIKNFDYILINSLGQFSDNTKINQNFKNKDNFNCFELSKPYKNKNVKYASYCFLNVNLFEKYGFFNIKSFKIKEEKAIYIFKKII